MDENTAVHSSDLKHGPSYFINSIRQNIRFTALIHLYSSLLLTNPEANES